MRPATRQILFSAAILVLVWVLAGCRALTGPVGRFEPPAAPPAELADRIGERLRPYKSLTAEMETTGRARFQLRPTRNTVLVRYRPPDAVLLGLGHVPFEPIGILLRVIQNGENLAVLDPHGGAGEPAFYTGTVRDLEDFPGLLYGLQPRDVASPLVGTYEAADALRQTGPGASLPAPSFWRRTWRVEKKNETGGRTVYKLRLRDGLVEEIAVYDGQGKRQVRILYREYGDFDGAVFPSRFDLFCRGGLRLRAQVLRVKIHDVPGDEKFFSLDPPAGASLLPLSEFLARIGR